MNNGLDLYFLNQRIFEGGPPWTPPRGGSPPKILKKCFGSCDISNEESPRKTLFKYVDYVHSIFEGGPPWTPLGGVTPPPKKGLGNRIETGRWFFGMNNGLDFYFHNLKELLRGGGHPGPPLQGGNPPKYWKKCFGSCDISNESPRKTLFKYVDWMFIRPLILLSVGENVDENYLFFYSWFVFWLPECSFNALLDCPLLENY